MANRSIEVRLAPRAGLTVAGCAGLLAVVYLVAVRTASGQAFEDAVLRAGDAVAGGRGDLIATGVLALVTAVTLGVLLVVVLGVFRRARAAAVAGLGLVVASVVTTEAMQRLVLRPLLLDSGTRREDQSFPSGHAAVALATMCAVVLVMPPRWRVPAVLVTSVWAVAITVATVVANWHRPSDTIGSGLIVLGYLAAAVGLLARSGSARAIEPTSGVRRLRQGYTVAAGAAVTVAVWAVFWGDVLFAGRAIAVASSLGVTWGLVVLIQSVGFEAGAVGSDKRSSDA